MSKIDELWKLIKENSDTKGYVKGLDTLTLNQQLNLNKHDINKYLGDLKKRGLLGYSERKGGKDGSLILYRFRLRTPGIQQVVSERVMQSKESVGSEDKLDVPGWPMDTATSDGPAEVADRPVEMEKPIWHAYDATCEMMHPGEAHAAWKRKKEHRTLDEPVPAGASSEATAPTDAEAEEASSATTAAQRPSEPPGDRYPRLIALLDRKRLAEQASKNLEALGADNLALEALALVDLPLMPLQKEIVQFFADHPEFVRYVVEPEG